METSLTMVLYRGVAFISGNFIYQALQEAPNYLIALERSYFQGALLLFILFLLRGTIKF